MADPQYPSSPLLHLKMEEGTGTSLADSGSAAATGTIVNSYTWTDGKIEDGALRFVTTPTRTYVNVNEEADFRVTGDISISFWIYLYSYGGTSGAMILGKSNSTSNTRCFVVEVNASGTVSMSRGDGASSAYVSSTSAIPLNRWVNVTIVDSSKTMTIYFDKTSVGSNSYTLTPTTAATYVLRLGALANYLPGSARTLDAILDDVLIYSSALDSDDISMLYDNGVGVITATVKPVYTINTNVSSQGKYTPLDSFHLPSQIETPNTRELYHPSVILDYHVINKIPAAVTTAYRLGPKVWVAPANGNASVGSNWSDGIAPKIGDEILFDSTSTYNCTWNVTTQVGYFRIATGYTGTITNSVAFSCGEFRQEDGVFTVAGGALSHYYYGTFRLYGGVYNGNSGSTCLYYGSASITSSSYGTAGQMCFMTDGSWFYFNGNLNLTHLGFRGSISMTDCIGYVRCITQFYCISASGEKTLTLNNSKIRIYHTAVAAIDVTGTWNMVGSNGAVLQIALYDNRTLDTELSEINLDINLEFLGVSGQVAAAELEMNQAINVGENYNITVYTEDATQTFYLDTNNYTMTCHDLTVSARGYLKGGTSSFHIYGSLTTYLGTSIFSSSTVYMYNAGENIECNGYTNRIRYLHLLPSTGTITSGAINTTTLLIDTSGYINGNGCTLALGNARLYQYTANATVCFQGTGTITSNQNGTAGYWFILYALTQTSAFTNLNQGNWTFDCDVFFSPERSMTYAIETWLTGNIVTSKTLRIAHAGSYGLKPHLQGYDITAHTMLWNSTYGYLVYVDASVGSSEIRVTGGSFTAYNGYVQLESGQSHLYLEGTGNVYPASLHFYDVTVSGTYTVQVAHGWCDHSRTVTGTLNQSLGYNLWYRMLIPSSASLKWKILESVAAVSRRVIWAIRNSIGTTKTMIWSMRNYSRATKKTIWNIYNVISSSDTLKWNLRTIIYTYDRYVWNLRNAVGTSDRYIWNDRNLISVADRHVWNIRTYVSVTDRYVWKIWNSASTSRKVIWNVIGKISGTRKFLYSISGNIRTGVVISYTIRRIIGDYRAHLGLFVLPTQIESSNPDEASILAPTYSIRGRIYSPNTLLWSIRHAIGVSDKLIWNDRNSVSGTARLIYIVRNLLVPGRVKTIWNTRGMVTSSDVFKWNVRNNINTIDKFMWNVLAKVSVSDTYLWNNRNGISVRTKYVWNVFGAIRSSDVYIWNVRNSVSASERSSWNIWNKAISNKRIIWNVIRKIGASGQYRWNILGGISVQKKIIWNLLGRISATDRYIWGIRSSIATSNSTYIYNILRMTGDTRTGDNVLGEFLLPSHIETLRNITPACSAVYDIRSLVLSADSLRWNIRNTIFRTTNIRWNILRGINSFVRSIWNIRHIISASDLYVWNVRGALRNSARLIWNIKTIVSASTDTYIWNIRKSIGVSEKLIWNVNKNIFSTRTVLWNLRKSINTFKTYNWNIRSAICGRGSFSWNVIGALRNTFTISFSILKIVGDYRNPLGGFLLPSALEHVTFPDESIILVPTYSVRRMIHADEPILCLPLNQDSGLVAFDHSGSDRHGTLTSDIWDAGKLDEGVYFDGVTRDYVEIPNSGLRPANITVSAWIKPVDSTATLRAIVSAGRDAWIAGYNFFTNGLKLNVRLEIGPTFEYNADDISISSSDCLTIGEWNHVAFTYDSDGLVIYCNGSIVGSTSYIGDIKYEWYDTPVTIGIMSMYRETTGYFKFFGYIDEVRIYDRALTQDEIERHYQTDYYAIRRTLRWNIRNLISATDRYVWNIRNYVSTQDKYVWNIRNLINAHDVIMWSIIGKVRTTKSMSWNVRNAITNARTVLYSISGAIFRVINLQYTILRKIGEMRGQLGMFLLPGQIESVTSEENAVVLTPTYSILGKIGASSKYILWNIRVLIGTSDAYIYSMRNLRTASAGMTWNIMRGIFASKTTIWNVIGKIIGSNTYVWNLKRGVVSVNTQRYNIFGPAIAAIILKYNIRRMIGERRESLGMFLLPGQLETVSSEENAVILVPTYSILNTLNASPKRMIWNILVAIGVSDKYVYSVRNFRNVSVNASWNIRNIAATSAKILYSIYASSASSTLSLRWSIYRHTSSTSSFVWSLSGALFKTVTQIYNIRKMVWDERDSLGGTTLPTPIGADSFCVPNIHFKYTIKSFTTKLVRLQYRIQNIMTASSSESWNILQMVSPSDVNLLYAISNFARLTVALRYSIANGIRRRLIPYWNINASVAADFDTMWNVRNKIVADSLVIYNVRSLLRTSARTIYNIRNYISVKRTLVYHLSGSLARMMVALRYNIMGRVATSDKYTWNIRKYIGSSNRAVWNIRNFAAAVSVFSYTIRGTLIATAFRSIYNIRMKLRSEVESSWNIFGYAHSVKRILYNMRNAISSDTPLSYNIRNYISKSGSFGWNIRGKLIGAVIYLWNIRKNVAGRRTLIYNMRNSIRHGISIGYSIRKMLGSVSSAFSYNILLPIGSMFSTIYSVINRPMSAFRVKYNIFPGRPKEHGLDPYAQLREDIYNYLLTKTVLGGEFEGFLVYRKRPTIDPMFFPCLVIDILEGEEIDQFGASEYSESCAINVEIWFKRDEVKILEYI